MRVSAIRSVVSQVKKSVQQKSLKAGAVAIKGIEKTYLKSKANQRETLVLTAGISTLSGMVVADSVNLNLIA